MGFLDEIFTPPYPQRKTLCFPTGFITCLKRMPVFGGTTSNFPGEEILA